MRIEAGKSNVDAFVMYTGLAAQIDAPTPHQSVESTITSALESCFSQVFEWLVGRMFDPMLNDPTLKSDDPLSLAVDMAWDDQFEPQDYWMPAGISDSFVP